MSPNRSLPDSSRLADLLGDLLPRTTFPDPGTPLVCGVSGGADSIALLGLAVASGCRATAVHVDHGQRPGSAAEATLVRDVALEVGAEFRSERVEVAAGGNLEARLRAARYAVLGPDAATGHTLDDQAETVVINLLRGAGLVGLGAMQPGHRRPILGLRRAETLAVCTRLGVEPFEDPSNTDPRHLRNRVRNEVLPLLIEVSGRDPVALLARSATHARAAAGVLDGLADELDPTDAKALAAAPAPVAARALQRWIRTHGDAEHPIDSSAVDRVLAVARGEAIAAEVNGGLRVERSQQRLSVRVQATET